MKADMSASAVDGRLRRVSQLRRPCLSLARAGKRAEKAPKNREEKPASAPLGDKG